ncbi:hypothetical protein FN846DRAFT_903714 [Sphaerosporella brunnea]|uniref:Uncharacterized protein n=1 Tax=Sphaerosporella brunnea TaxID=1250544 RepID=A0A5J5F6V2_9PEZI|nr:hypothetical protein FN846DRAFT_903714 [Sphaerosporella brunnea]
MPAAEPRQATPRSHLRRSIATLIVFDHTRSVDTSCSLVEDRKVAAVRPALHLLRSFSRVAKENTNALMQERPRRLRANLGLSIATLRNLDNLHTAHDTMEIHRIQTILLARFVASNDNAHDVIVSMQCADLVCTMKTTWCKLSSPTPVPNSSRPPPFSATPAEAWQPRLNSFNTADVIQLVQPSTAHPVTDVDEDSGDWKPSAGLLRGGIPFFTDGHVFNLYHPLRVFAAP